MGWFSAYVKRCSPVYHHDNSGDGDITIGESFGGVGRIGSKCGIFHDNDQVYINGECCSPAITIYITMFNNYHDCNGDEGKAVDDVFGCNYEHRNDAGIFHDNDIIARHNLTGSPI